MRRRTFSGAKNYTCMLKQDDKTGYFNPIHALNLNQTLDPLANAEVSFGRLSMKFEWTSLPEILQLQINTFEKVQTYQLFLQTFPGFTFVLTVPEVVLYCLRFLL